MEFLLLRVFLKSAGRPLKKNDVHNSAQMELYLLNTYFNTGIQDMCPMFQKLKILIGGLH